MQKRLEKVEPMYKISECVEDWKKNAELTKMITTYPSITDSSPPTRKKVVSRLVEIIENLSNVFLCRELKLPQTSIRYCTYE